MADAGSVKTAQFISTTNVGLTTSSKYPLGRGPYTIQSTVVAVGTGTSVFNGICTVNASNDNLGWHPIGTVTALGTLAAAGTSTGTGSDLTNFANQPYRMAQATVNTTATGAGLTFSSTVTLGM